MARQRLAGLFRRFVSNRRGNLAVYSTLAMIPIVGGVSMAVEYSNGLRQESKLQNLLDAAVLPNRDVTYNSTTNVSGSKINLVVNTLIMNSANWSFEGFSGGASSGMKTVYLSK